MQGFPIKSSAGRLASLRPAVPGLAAASAAVLTAHVLHLLVPALPVLTIAVILGLAAANLPGLSAAASGPLKPGLTLAAKKLMRAGVVLLGLKVSLVDIAGLGGVALVSIAALVVVSFAGTYLLCRAFGLRGDTPLLIASGFSICGVSAISAMAAARRIRHEDTLVPVALVTLCGTLAIGVLPLLASLLHLSPGVLGFWSGASVHDVGQVVATASTAGSTALAAAVVVKLARVVMLAPMTAFAGLAGRRGSKDDTSAKGSRPPLVPLFVAAFIVMIGIRSLGILPDGVLAAAALAQDILFAAALFGLGAAVRLRSLAVSGGGVLGAALASWALIAALGLGLALLLVG